MSTSEDSKKRPPFCNSWVNENYTPVREAPTSIIAYRKYGVSPSTLRYAMYNIFYFPEKYADCMYLIKQDTCDTSPFLRSIKEGMIQKVDRSYQIIYHQTDPYKLRRRAKHGNSHVKLSFRVAQPEFNIPPTVLVTEITEILEK